MKQAVLILTNNSTGELKTIQGKNDKELYEVANPIVHEFFSLHDKATCEMYEDTFQVRVWEKPNTRNLK